MKLDRIAIAALAIALFAAPATQASAQNVFVVNRGMLGIRHEAVPSNAINARNRVVVEVVKGSPAEKAGLVKGDTILSINGLAATSAVMNAPFEPGDTVTLRVKRAGRERSVRIVAAESSNRVFSAVRGAEARYVLPDTVMGNISIIMDRIQTNMDSAGRATVRIRTPRGDSVFTYAFGDTTFMRSAGRGGVFRAFPHDSMNVFITRADSLFGRFRMMSPDSAHGFVFRSFGGDSVFGQLFGDRTGTFTFHMDSVGLMRPRAIFENGFSIGMRAVAGAELTEMNEGLAEYFGAPDGVLVTAAREGTPAGRAGLRGGDVILRVNNSPVRSINELRRAIDNADGRTVTLRVLRRGQNVDVTLGRE